MGPSVKFVLWINSSFSKRKLGVIFNIRKNTKPGGGRGRFGKTSDFLQDFFCETFRNQNKQKIPNNQAQTKLYTLECSPKREKRTTHDQLKNTFLFFFAWSSTRLQFVWHLGDGAVAGRSPSWVTFFYFSYFFRASSNISK